jgi:DNA-binding MarR family transcriptional regulator
VIEQSTATELAAVLRDLVRSARAVMPDPGGDALSSVTAGLLGVLATGGELRLGQLARSLGVDVSVASRQAAAAQSRGLVDRRPHPEDGRACLFSLTGAGHEALAAHQSARAAWLQDAARTWTDAEAGQLVRELGRLRDDVRAVTPAGREPHSLVRAG